MDALEDQVGDNPLNGALIWFYQIDIFRTDYHIYRPVAAKACVHTGKTCS